MDELNRLRSKQIFSLGIDEYGCVYVRQPIQSLHELLLLGQSILAQKIEVGDCDKEGNGIVTLTAAQGYTVKAYVYKLPDMIFRNYGGN